MSNPSCLHVRRDKWGICTECGAPELKVLSKAFLAHIVACYDDPCGQCTMLRVGRLGPTDALRQDAAAELARKGQLVGGEDRITPIPGIRLCVETGRPLDVGNYPGPLHCTAHPGDYACTTALYYLDSSTVTTAVERETIVTAMLPAPTLTENGTSERE